MAPEVALTACQPTVNVESVFGTVLESLHHALNGPNNSAARKDDFDVQLALQIIVVCSPLAAVGAYDHFANVRSQRKYARTELFRKEAARNGLAVFAVFMR